MGLVTRGVAIFIPSTDNRIHGASPVGVGDQRTTVTGSQTVGRNCKIRTCRRDAAAFRKKYPTERPTALRISNVDRCIYPFNDFLRKRIEIRIGDGYGRHRRGIKISSPCLFTSSFSKKRKKERERKKLNRRTERRRRSLVKSNHPLDHSPLHGIWLDPLDRRPSYHGAGALDSGKNTIRAGPSVPFTDEPIRIS